MCVPGRRRLTRTRPAGSVIRPTRTKSRGRTAAPTAGGSTARSAQPAVALLVFLPGAARAGLVAADLRLLANVRRHGLRGRADARSAGREARGRSARAGADSGALAGP